MQTKLNTEFVFCVKMRFYDMAFDILKSRQPKWSAVNHTKSHKYTRFVCKTNVKSHDRRRSRSPRGLELLSILIMYCTDLVEDTVLEVKYFFKILNSMT